MSGRESNLDKAVAIFRHHRGIWISALIFRDHCGGLSSRTRISECRRVLGARIPNDTVPQPGEPTKSYYCCEVNGYLPRRPSEGGWGLERLPVAPAQADLFGGRAA
jgi:hypothetical protein